MQIQPVRRSHPALARIPCKLHRHRWLLGVQPSCSTPRRHVNKDGAAGAPSSSMACAMSDLRDWLWLLRLRLLRFLECERKLAFVVDVDRDVPAADEPTEQELVGKRLANRVLDEPRHRSRAHLRIE